MSSDKGSRTRGRWQRFRKRAPQRIVLIALLLCICANAATISFMAWRRAEEISDARLVGANTAELLAAQIERIMRALNVLDRNVIDFMGNRQVNHQQDLEAVVREWPTHEHLVTLQALAGPLQAVAIINREGMLIAGSREWPTRRRTVRDRGYFQAFLRDERRDRFVGETAPNRRDGAWMIPVAFRLPLGAEQFGGVLYCGVPLEFIEGVLKSVNLGTAWSAALLRSDGLVLASSEPGLAKSGARALGALSLLRQSEDPAWVQTVEDSQIVSIREVGRWPLFVRVVQPFSTILSPWWREVWAAMIGTVFLNTILALATSLALRQIKISEKLAEKEHEAARRDPLTGLPNRIAFQEEVAEVFRWATDIGISFTLLLIDVDRFKAVNDTLGHHAGDTLLIEIGKRLDQARSPNSFLSRLGGDEFAIIHKGGDVELLAQTLLRQVSAPMLLYGRQLTPAISIGSARGPRDGESSELLLDNADLALYRAKALGRGAHCAFSAPIRAAEVAKFELVHALKTAIDERRLSLAFQPISCLRQGHVVGFEALARWDDREKGRIPPATFIPLAEESGLISTLGRYVLEEACQTAMSWPSNLSVAVNLSAAQFAAGDVLDDVERILARTGLAPHRLELEITESLALSDAAASKVLYRLKRLGCGISLDDFGTGYASLSYLQSFPFDRIKIDRSFIQNMLKSREAEVIVRTVIDLARDMNFKVTAEGIETPAQLARLSALGCTKGQGFLIGRPMPAAAVHEFLTGVEVAARSVVQYATS